MPSSNQAPEPGANPLAGETGVDPLLPLEQLAHWLMSATVHVALGLVLGAIAARTLRSRHLHWSWATCGLAFDVLTWSLLGSWSLTLGVAALGAGLRGRRWHREDIDAGADLAEIARRRYGPLNALGALIRQVERRDQSLRTDGWFRGERLIVGRDDDGRDVSIQLGGSCGGTHTLVVGAAGSGKTVTQTWIAVRAIEHRMAAIVIDPKGDRDMCEEVRRAAQLAGRRFVEWTPTGPCAYNPYARGGETEIADKVLAGERFTEPHYLRQAQRYLGHVVRALRNAGQEVSLQGIVSHLDPARLELLVRSLPEHEAQKTDDYLDSLTERQRSDLAGVRDRLAILAESDVGRWLEPRTDTGQFDLLEAVKDKAVVYFNLEADRRPLLTQMLGAAIVQDLQTTVAALQGRPVESLVVIEELSAIAPEHVSRLFARARGAGMSLLLGTQELSDLRLPGREALLDQVMGNLSVLIAHRQVVPDSAELIASLAGTRGAWRTSRTGDGRSTRTRTREAVLDAGEVTGLARGWAAVIALSDHRGVRIARIFSVKHRR
jgi:type IV secretory pathway TraG/TraD family ATPase VirD4